MNDSHQKAAEYHNPAAQAHRTAAEHHGQEDHLTGHEHSRRALEHSNETYQQSSGTHPKGRPEHGVIVPAKEAIAEEIAVLAYELWQARGCPEGSPQEDWFRAVEKLQSHN
jgi:hypothetical protein